jgi:hypothetical protein
VSNIQSIPDKHPSDPKFSPRPFEDINKDAKVFIYMNGKLVDGPLNMDRLHPQFKDFLPTEMPSI